MVDMHGPCIDIAIDLGSTNICLTVFSNKEKIYSSRIQNSLYKYGPDIITRLTRVLKENALVSVFQASLLSDIKYLISGSQIQINHIENIYIGANTVMLYFLFAKDVASLGSHPFKAEIKADDVLSLQEVFMSKIATVDEIIVPPILGGYVGSDMSAVLYYLQQVSADNNYAVVDMGTNAEIAVRTGENCLVASVAAGPAFGYHGSDLIARVSLALSNGEITRDGYLLQENQDVSQAQIRNLQLAKAAVFTGLSTLLHLIPEPIEKVFIAGVFGGMLAAENIAEIKLLPAELTKIEYCGNASLAGLEEMVKNNVTGDALLLKGNIEFVELANSEIFSVNYIRNMNF